MPVRDRVLTRVCAVEAGLDEVVELEDEGAGLCEEREVARDVLKIRPDDAVASGGLRRRRAPDCSGGGVDGGSGDV